MSCAHMRQMNVYTNTKFTGLYPVGVAAVVVSDSRENAAKALNKELKSGGLKGDAKAKDMELLKTGKPVVLVLRNGDY